MEASNDADVPGEPLTLVVQLPQFPQLDLAQRRPTAEEKRHAFVTMMPRITKLVVVEPREVLRKVLDHRGRHRSAAPGASAIRRFGRPPLAKLTQPLPDPRGQASRDLHRYLASAALGAVASEVNAEREARETQW